MEKVKFNLAEEQAAAKSGGGAAFEALKGKKGVKFTLIEKWVKKLDNNETTEKTKNNARGVWIMAEGQRLWANLSQIIDQIAKVPAVKGKLISGTGQNTAITIGDGTVLVGDFDPKGNLELVALAEGRSA